MGVRARIASASGGVWHASRGVGGAGRAGAQCRPGAGRERCGGPRHAPHAEGQHRRYAVVSDASIRKGWL